MAFPSVITSFSYPSPTNRLDNPSHSGLENTQSSAIGQLQAFIGTDASAVGTLQYDIRSPLSDGGGHVQTANKGGTGQTSYTKGDLLIAQSSSVFTKFAIGADGAVLSADSTTAAGVAWRGTQDATTIVVQPVGGHLGTDAAAAVPPSSILMNISLQAVPFQIRVNKISFVQGSVMTQGNINVALYNQAGTASVLFGTATTSIAGNAEVVRTIPVTSVLVSAGNYWVGVTGTAIFNSSAWDLSDAASGGEVILSSVLGGPVASGRLPAIGGALPGTITPSNISWNVSTAFVTRLDT